MKETDVLGYIQMIKEKAEAQKKERLNSQDEIDLDTMVRISNNEVPAIPKVDGKTERSITANGELVREAKSK